MQTSNFTSIIIPALNEEKVMGQCLPAINNLSTPKEQFEVIVVDNGSTDNTIEIARSYGARVYVKRWVNISSLRNYGAKQSRGNILAFVDADCIVTKYWLDNALDTLKDPKIGATGSVHEVSSDASWVAKAWNISKLKKKKTYFTNYVPSGNIFLRKECFFKVGGFDENLSVSEDTDLCYRLRQKNYKVLANKNISVIHLGAPQTLKQLFIKELWHGKDVFRIFLNSKFQLRNFKVVMFALFYVLCLICIAISIPLCLFAQSYLPLGVILFAMMFVPLLLAIKTVFIKKEYKYLIGLFLVYLTFGTARAVCIFDLRNWLIIRKT